MPRIAVFIDGSNLFYLTRYRLGWEIDYEKLLQYISQWGEITDATFYTGVNPTRESGPQFLDYLCNVGFSVITKPTKEIFDDKSGKFKLKANLDVEIVLDLFNTIENYDLAVLISGDSDFERSLQQLKARGKRFKIMSSNGFMSRELRQLAGMHYVDLSEIKCDIERCA
ncbi:MAG: NYN domain-containing protein [Eubacteriales bacterium]|nr:NYN domain-containing protein [Eubacteriales bacterium]